MNHPLGTSRTVVKARHAIFAPDGFVPSTLPGWTHCVINILISPALGADFSQTRVLLERSGRGTGTTDGTEIFGYVQRGQGSINGHKLETGSYFYLPPDSDYDLRSAAKNTELTLFQKDYNPHSEPAPKFLTGHESDIAGVPFLGYENARLQVLLPDTLPFDMAVNLFTYDAGAALPFVETHIMEHGLLMLDGGGIYRLENEWYPVQTGDVIWMAPYCPQWFIALAPGPARYLYYKDVNRSPL